MGLSILLLLLKFALSEKIARLLPKLQDIHLADLGIINGPKGATAMIKNTVELMLESAGLAQVEPVNR